MFRRKISVSFMPEGKVVIYTIIQVCFELLITTGVFTFIPYTIMEIVVCRSFHECCVHPQDQQYPKTRF